jgi:hypothetical protein
MTEAFTGNHASRAEWPFRGFGAAVYATSASELSPHVEDELVQ